MVRSECVFCAAMLAAMFSQAAAAKEIAPVGAYGDPARLAIEGARSYDAAEISRVLATDLDVAYASCADRPLEELKALLVDKVRQAYLRHGFADVRVVIRQEPSRLVLTISEGRQFKAGEIRIIGARSIDAQALADGLTKKRERDSLENELTTFRDDASTKGRAIRWAVGEPARIDEAWQKDLGFRVEVLLQDQGYFGARFSLSPEVDRRRGVVALRIAIANEGVRLTAADLEIVGNERNSRDAILNYLGLAADAVLTSELRSSIEKALNDSARFVNVRLRAAPSHFLLPIADVRLSQAASSLPRLVLVEYDQVPPLDQPLSREEAALVKLYHWTQEFNKGADEITADINVEGVRGGLVSTHDAGLVAWIGGPPGARPGGASPPFDLAFVSTDTEIGVYSYRRGRKLASPITPVPVMLLVGWTLAQGPPWLDGSGGYSIGVGAINSNVKKKRHCEFRFMQSAVGAVSLTHQKDATMRWQGDVLTILRPDKGGLVIDARTGRLLEQNVAGEDNPFRSRMYFSQGAFPQKLREIKASAERFENFASPRFPASCIAAYACDEWSYWSDATKIRWMADLAPVVRKLVDKGLLVPIDRALLAPTPPELKFTLARSALDVDSRNNMPATVRFLVQYCGIEFADRLAPRGSWLWQTAREAMFVADGKRDRLVRVLDDLKSDASGPIRCLAASALLDLGGYETEARDVARAGLKNASLTQFRNDYRDLLAPGFYLGDHLLRAAEMLRELDAAEVDSLARGAVELGLVDERGGRLFIEAIRRLREQPGERADRLLPRIFDDLWAAGLRNCVELALESAATIPPPPVSFENFAQEQLRRIDEMKRMLRELNLPPEELKRQLKEIEKLERGMKGLDELERKSRKPGSPPDGDNHER